LDLFWDKIKDLNSSRIKAHSQEPMKSEAHMNTVWLGQQSHNEKEAAKDAALEFVKTDDNKALRRAERHFGASEAYKHAIEHVLKEANNHRVQQI